MRILIVEDDLTNQKVLAAFLTTLGEIVIANNGLEALALFEDGHTNGNPFNLIFLDIMMPGIDGHETLRRLRRAESAHNIEGLDRVPVIVTTCLEDSKNILGAFRIGAEGYLTKPIDRSRLSALLARLELPSLMAPKKELSEELQIFVIEASENLDQIESLLLDLERCSNAANSVNQLFRSIHTIKGNCGFLGLQSLESFCHRAESILDAIRSGRGAVTPAIAELLLHVVDAGRHTLEVIQELGSDNTIAFPELNLQLEETLNHLRSL